MLGPGLHGGELSPNVSKSGQTLQRRVDPAIEWNKSGSSGLRGFRFGLFILAKSSVDLIIGILGMSLEDLPSDEPSESATNDHIGWKILPGGDSRDAHCPSSAPNQRLRQPPRELMGNHRLPGPTRHGTAGSNCAAAAVPEE